MKNYGSAQKPKVQTVEKPVGIHSVDNLLYIQMMKNRQRYNKSQAVKKSNLINKDQRNKDFVNRNQKNISFRSVSCLDGWSKELLSVQEDKEFNELLSIPVKTSSVKEQNYSPLDGPTQDSTELDDNYGLNLK